MSSRTQNGSRAHDESGCFIKQLPPRLLERAAKYAVKVHPLNSPVLSPSGLDTIQPAELTVLTGKYWGPNPRTLTVSFMENPPADLRARILGHMNAWECSITFVQAPPGQIGNVRISLTGPGFWSFHGTDIMLIPPDQPTMNLHGFNMWTDESEYRRVVRHETGHTLGFPHEHLRRQIVEDIIPEKAYEYYWARLGWDRAKVDHNVLNPLEQTRILAGPLDQDSIMCYSIPASITRSGRGYPGGPDISPADRAFATTIYPPRSAAPAEPCWLRVKPKDLSVAVDWGEENDVHLPELSV